MKVRLFILSCLFSWCFSAPPEEIPDELRDKYTLNGKVPVYSWYIDGTQSEATFYSKQLIDDFIARIKQKEENYYIGTDKMLYQAMEENLDLIHGKKVAILGSTTPWYEGVVLSYGGIPTTIEYNKIETNDERIRLITVKEFKENPELFDIVISISSFEHDGLGRYGDPLDPEGDFRAMDDVTKMLKPGGLLFLAVPIGPDALYWNAHRVYGALRLPMLLDKWNIVKSYGFVESDLMTDARKGVFQPVFVLKGK